MSLVDLGGLATPITTLIEKISDAVGGIARPGQIKRVANAEAQATLIKAKANIEVTELEERALQRMIKEEAIKQINIESITEKAIPLVAPDAKPENIENDWLANFFDKGKLISDEEMQQIWAAMLAGEANKPGSFSKRTVELVSTLDKKEAELFTNFASTIWMIGNSACPLIFDLNKPPVLTNALTFSDLMHLDSLGLIKAQSVGGFAQLFPTSDQEVLLIASYFGKTHYLTMPTKSTTLETGSVALTAAGKQLANLCGANPNVEFYHSIIQRWIDQNLRPYEFLFSGLSSTNSWYNVTEEAPID